MLTDGNERGRTCTIQRSQMWTAQQCISAGVSFCSKNQVEWSLPKKRGFLMPLCSFFDVKANVWSWLQCQVTCHLPECKQMLSWPTTYVFSAKYRNHALCGMGLCSSDDLGWCQKATPYRIRAVFCVRLFSNLCWTPCTQQQFEQFEKECLQLDISCVQVVCLCSACHF